MINDIRRNGSTDSVHVHELFRKTLQARNREIIEKIEKIKFGYEPPYEGDEDKDMEREWKGRVKMLNDIQDIITTLTGEDNE